MCCVCVIEKAEGEVGRWIYERRWRDEEKGDVKTRERKKRNRGEKGERGKKGEKRGREKETRKGEKERDRKRLEIRDYS